MNGHFWSGHVWIIGLMALAVGTTASAKTNLFADLPRIEQIKVAEAAELKGDLARIHEEYGNAVNYYRTALRASPGDAKIQNKLGIAYLQMGNHGSARKAFVQAVKIDPYSVNALNNLGAVNCLDKKFNPAIRYLKQALALDENNASAHLNLAEAWAGLGEMDRAMTEYARALELDADILSSSRDGVTVHVNTPEQRARVDFLIARAYAKRGNLEGALEYLDRAKENHFTDLAKVYDDQVFAGLWADPRLQKIVKR
jgi:tetratricopeptide (TPR) repeat protein